MWNFKVHKNELRVFFFLSRIQALELLWSVTLYLKGKILSNGKKNEMVMYDVSLFILSNFYFIIEIYYINKFYLRINISYKDELSLLERMEVWFSHNTSLKINKRFKFD